MKNKFALLFIGLILSLAISCGGKYNDVKAVMNDMNAAQETLANSLNNAKSVDDAAKALDTFAGAMEKIVPKMKAAQKKHPNLKAETPPELKPIMDNTSKVAKKLGEAMAKVQTSYGTDPKFLDAQKKYLEVLTKMVGN